VLRQCDSYSCENQLNCCDVRNVGGGGGGGGGCGGGDDDDDDDDDAIQK
jgi:hypothetical protein